MVSLENRHFLRTPRRIPSHPLRRRVAFLAVCLLGSGCAVGPDFEKPAPPDVTAYTPQPLSATVAAPNIAGGEAQRFVAGGEISGDWWTLFHSQSLNELIDEALKNNHDLKAAQAAMKAAREHVFAQQGAYYPSVSAKLCGQPPEAVGNRSRRRRTTTPFSTISSRRKSAFPMCPMFSA